MKSFSYYRNKSSKKFTNLDIDTQRHVHTYSITCTEVSYYYVVDDLMVTENDPIL
jgi:hypothetical protein